MSPGNDINITGVWKQGITGKGVTVVILDDGLDYNSTDLADNFVSFLSIHQIKKEGILKYTCSMPKGLLISMITKICQHQSYGMILMVPGVPVKLQRLKTMHAGLVLHMNPK